MLRIKGCYENENITMTKPKWLMMWMRAPFLLNFYPCMGGAAGYVLLLYLPENVLTLHPALKLFTDLMSKLVPGIPAFAGNVQQESVLFVHALSWALIPLWIPLYQFWRLGKSNLQIINNIKRSHYDIKKQKP